jgi:hypothetical protein
LAQAQTGGETSRSWIIGLLVLIVAVIGIGVTLFTSGVWRRGGTAGPSTRHRGGGPGEPQSQTP